MPPTEILLNFKHSYITWSNLATEVIWFYRRDHLWPAHGLLALLPGLIVPVLILPRKMLAISVLPDILVLAVAATLIAVVALDLIDPTRVPTGIVNVQVDLSTTGLVVVAVLFAVGGRSMTRREVRKGSKSTKTGGTHRYLMSNVTRSSSLYFLLSSSMPLRYVSKASLYLHPSQYAFNFQSCRPRLVGVRGSQLTHARTPRYDQILRST